MTKPMFNVGDQVVFTNEYGVCFGVRTVTAVVQVEWDKNPRYHYTPSDSPWFPTAEQHLTKATDRDLKAQEEGDDAYFQEKYGFGVTREQLAALLDNEYDI